MDSAHGWGAARLRRTMTLLAVGAGGVGLAIAPMTAAQSDVQTLASVSVPVSQWTYATSTNTNGPTTDPTIAQGDPSPAALEVRVGNDTTGKLYRGFLQFPLVYGGHDLRGKQILDLQLAGRVDHTWSCNNQPTYFYRTAAIATTPRQSWPGPALQVALGNVLVHANEAGCPQPNQSFELGTPTLRNDLQAAANAFWSSYTIGVSARSFDGTGETLQSRWARYFLNDFQLQVVYDAGS